MIPRQWGKLGALLLAAAMAGPGIPVHGASGAHCAPARTPETPRSAAAAALAGSLPQPTPEAWARWWQSESRPRTEQHVIHVNGRRIELFREALLPGWHYPYTDRELEAALRDLPPAWLVRLRSVRLTFHPEWDAMARTDRARIEISYVVDDALRAWGEVEDDSPEELRFGARLERWDGRRYVVWPDREALRIYILRHVLIHELGHHVAPPNLDPDDEENWAEAFAFRYYTPPAARPVAAAH